MKKKRNENNIVVSKDAKRLDCFVSNLSMWLWKREVQTFFPIKLVWDVWLLLEVCFFVWKLVE